MVLVFSSELAAVPLRTVVHVTLIFEEMKSKSVHVSTRKMPWLDTL